MGEPKSNPKMERPVTPERIVDFVAKYGRTASHTLSYLGKHQPFVAAMSSEIGAKLLEDDIQRWQTLFDKIARMEEKDEERVEFRYLSRRLETVYTRISQWLDQQGKITKS